MHKNLLTFLTYISTIGNYSSGIIVVILNLLIIFFNPPKDVYILLLSESFVFSFICLIFWCLLEMLVGFAKTIESSEEKDKNWEKLDKNLKELEKNHEKN